MYLQHIHILHHPSLSLSNSMTVITHERNETILKINLNNRDFKANFLNFYGCILHVMIAHLKTSSC